MADLKITQLPAEASPALDDLVAIVDDVAGTPTTKKATLEDVLALAGGGGGLILVEKKTITSDSTDVTFSGLHGDTDKVYLLVGRIVVPSGGSTASFSWQPNAITTNQSGQRVYGNTTAVASDNLAVLWLVDGIPATTVSFSITIHASKVENSVAIIRTYSGTFQAIYTGVIAVGTIAGQWNETSTNITSLVIHSSQASKIGDGSTFALYKYAQS